VVHFTFAEVDIMMWA